MFNLIKSWKEVREKTDTLKNLIGYDEIEYCKHIHNGECQETKDCPCVQDHECENGIVKQSSCLKCGESILGNSDSICGNCAGE